MAGQRAGGEGVGREGFAPGLLGAGGGILGVLVSGVLPVSERGRLGWILRRGCRRGLGGRSVEGVCGGTGAGVEGIVVLRLELLGGVGGCGGGIVKDGGDVGCAARPGLAEPEALADVV